MENQYRVELKRQLVAAFPGTTFRVHARVGSSFSHVRWTGGPEERAVAAVTRHAPLRVALHRQETSDTPPVDGTLAYEMECMVRSQD